MSTSCLPPNRANNPAFSLTLIRPDAGGPVAPRDGVAARPADVGSAVVANKPCCVTIRRRDDRGSKVGQAFQNFNPEKVARFGESDIARLLGDAGIVRSRAKIEATIGTLII
jgi:hypothetical protein